MMPEKTIITSGSSNSSPLNPLSSPITCHVSSSSEGKVDEVSLGFQRDLASGELSKTIQPWDPWWLLASARIEGTQLVQCVEEEAIVVPRGPDKPLTSLSKITKTNPSPLLRFHLIDIVYSYCFTLRIYNGEWQSNSLCAATMVLAVSSVLGHDGRPETTKEALSFCLEKTCSSAYKNLGGGLKFGLNLVDDVICLLSLGSGDMVCLLCDLQRLILGAIKEVQSSSGSDLKKKLQLAEKKMFFMMCWVNEQSSEVWEALEQSVRAETNSGVEHKSYDVMDPSKGGKEVTKCAASTKQPGEPSSSSEGKVIMKGDEVSLDDLSLEERKCFQRDLASGELSKIIQPWDPWWLLAHARTINRGLGVTQLVQSIEEEEVEAIVGSEVPQGPVVASRVSPVVHHPILVSTQTRQL